MDWNTFFSIMGNFLLPVGNLGLASLIMTIGFMWGISKVGIGFEGSIVAGAAWLILASFWLLPIDLSLLIYVAIGIIMMLAFMRALRR